MNNNSISFSFIIPVYNVEDFLPECIESILSQTKNNYEIILVDDGSTDSSSKICDEYAYNYSDKIRVIHKKNEGVSIARNEGVRVSTKEYILFVDGDDCISPQTVEELLKVIEQKPDVILSETIFNFFNNKNNNYKSINFDRNDFRHIRGSEALKKTLSKRANWSSCDKAFRREYWEHHGFSFAPDRLGQDMQMIDWVVYEASIVSMIPGFYYYRRQREKSITNTVCAKRINDIIMNINDREKYMKEHKMDKCVLKELHNIHAKLFYTDVMGYIYSLSFEERKSILEEANKMVYLLNESTDKYLSIIKKISDVIGFNQTCRLAMAVKKLKKFCKDIIL